MPHRSFRLIVRLLSLALVLGIGLPALVTAAPASGATPGAPLSGRVTGATGAALADVTVTVHDPEEGDVLVATATTNAEGEYAVLDLPEGEYDVIATPPADDPSLLASATRWVQVGSADEVLDVQVEVSNVRGTVRRSDGSPAAGATVEVDDWDARAITYPDGTFRLAVPRGDWLLGVRPPAENPGLDVATTRPLAVAGTVLTPEVQLGQPRLRGRVLAPDGETVVAGAVVRLVEPDESHVPGGLATSRSDGSFGFDVPDGSYRLRVEPPLDNPSGWGDRRTGTFSVTAAHTPASPSVQDVVLVGPTLTGVVRAPGGDPVPRAWVHATSDVTGQYARARADARGRYGLDVPPGGLTVEIKAPAPTAAYLDHELHLDLAELPHVADLTFLRPNLTGRVLSVDGLPVANAGVTAYGPDPDGRNVRYATTDRQGRYALHLAPGSVQRIVAQPATPGPVGIRTARTVELPAEAPLDGFDVRLDAAPVPSYDLLPLEVSANGEVADSTSAPSISGDGSVVVVRADSSWCDCGRSDDSDDSDDSPDERPLPSAARSTPDPGYAGMVVRDLAEGTDELLLAPNGEVIDPIARVAVDDDASTVAFVSEQDDLGPDDAAGGDLFVLDRSSGTLSLVERAEETSIGSSSITLAGDGSRLVAVTGQADDDGAYRQDVVVVDLGPDGAETSRRSFGLQSRDAVDATLSRDGSTVAWTQYHRGGAGDGEWALHVLDLATGVEDAPRPFSEGVDDFNGWPRQAPSLSDDGRVVAYGDVSWIEVDGHDTTSVQVRVADRVAGTDRPVDPFHHAEEPDSAHIGSFALSGTGGELLVGSRGGVPEENAEQAWVVDLADGPGNDTAELVSRTAAGAPAYDGAHELSAPSDFSVLAFTTGSEDLSGRDRETVMVATAENEAPAWPDDAEITVGSGDVGSTSVRLQWTEATDNVRVVGYRVFRGAELVGTTDAATRQLRVTGLTPDTEYGFSVQAVDSRASVSTDGPSRTVRTLPEDSTELRPLDLAASVGGVVDLGWESARGAEQLLVRAYLGDTQVEEIVLAGDAASARLRGLAAATAYAFQVFTRTGGAGGVVAPFTERASVTTPGLTFTRLAWEVPTVRADLARRGSTAAITASAETGRTVQVAVDHLSWYGDEHELLDEPRRVTALVPLTEDTAAPGTYRGGFELVDGVARIVGMTGTVSDGHGGSVERAGNRPAIGVSNLLVVTVDAPERSLVGGRLQLLSASGAEVRSELLDGGAELVFEDLRAADDYRAVVVDGRGRNAGDRAGVRLRSGLAASVDLDPRLPAGLTVRVTGPAAARAGDTRVDLVDAASGDFLASRRLHEGEAGFLDVQEDQRVRVTVVHPATAMLRQPDPVELTLVAGANTVDVVAQDAPRAVLSGVVRYADGRPAAGVPVELRQRHQGQAAVFRTTAGTDGAYQIEGLRTAGELLSRSGDLGATVSVDLTGGPVERDVELVGPQTYTVSARLFVQPQGAPTETGPVALDWRTNVHYGATLEVDGRSASRPENPRHDDESGFTTVRAQAGDVLRWCIAGHEARVQRTCVERVLTSDPTPVLEMHAGPGWEALASIVDDRGVAVKDAVTDLYQVTDAGRVLLASDVQRHSRVTLPLPGEGSYLVEATAGDLTGSRAFTLTAGQNRLELGTLRLLARTHFGGSDNAVLASRPAVLPGGDVELRAAWRNRGAALGSVTARITVPRDAALVEGSLILDGRPVAHGSGPGYVEVDLGAVGADQSGSLRYRLRPTATAVSVPGQVELRYAVGGDPRVEPLVPVAVPVTPVSITGPATVATSTTTFSGRAPAGQTVALTDGGVAIGTAEAGPGGYWSATVTLAEQLRTEQLHRVVAEVALDGMRHFAEHRVVLDPARAQVVSVAVSQRDGEFANGRRFAFDPRDGVARFPFVFVPGQALDVEVTLDDPSLVARMDVLIGQRRIPATRRGDGVFVATVVNGSVSGPIRLDYDGLPKPLDLGEPDQPERVVRDGVPAPLRGFEVSAVVEPTASGATRTGAFSMSVPGVAGGSARATLSVSRETYTLTAEDVALERASGASVYDVSSTRSGSTLTFSMVVPVADLPGLAEHVERAEDDGAGAFVGGVATLLRNAIGPDAVRRAGAAGAAVGVARVSYQLAFNGTTTLDSLLSAIGAGDKYEKLANALKLTSGCSVDKIAAYDARAQRIAMAAAAGDIGGAAFNVASLVFGPATFGLGTVALGVLGWALDKAIGAQIDSAINDLALDIETDRDCRDPEKWVRPDPEPVADPVWIYDPSGYVYEGARSVRVPGVTATLLTAPAEDGPWTVWDAAWFGQTNPQTTDDQGRYGWDVPEGWWKVAWTKDGYAPAYSRVLRVLPPHLDVDVSMVKDGFPHVTASAFRGGGIDLTFDRLVRSDSATRGLTVVDPAGAEVPGTWTAVGAATGDGGRELQRGLRFAPAAPLAPGTRVTLTVAGVTDYSGRLMADAYTAELTVPRPTGGGGGGGPVDPVDTVPGAPGAVTATAGERSATVSWTAPDDGGSALLDHVVTVLPTGRQVTVAADETSVRIGELVAGTAYRFTVAARNAVGTGPASTPSADVVPTVVAPETELTAAPSGFVISRSARVAWAPTGATYRCELDGTVRSCDGDGLALERLRAGTHVLTVAAVDADGDADPTPATVRWTVPRDDRSLAGHGGWQRRSATGAFDGTLSRARSRGATLSASVSGATQLALVLAPGPRRGVVTVHLGRERLVRVDLADSARVVRLPAFDRPRSGTVRIVLASRRAPVHVDGLAVATG